MRECGEADGDRFALAPKIDPVFPRCVGIIHRIFEASGSRALFGDPNLGNPIALSTRETELDIFAVEIGGSAAQP